ncbi:NAD(P)H-binding protein [Vibrio zhugei]|uniref:NAD(P)H-binding protein n=1 Tax=Vibrio zhugei TaxID=2479546 RepID=A0ABV7CAZ8_9VIBR|nr:NAD(P)H-binding protein [Vibrio zhugei]
MSQIVIIGAGWLGKPLAQALLADGHHVSATSTSTDGVNRLQDDGIPAFECDLAKPETLQEHLKQRNCEIVIGCFPPGFRRGNADDYIHYWASIVTHARTAGVKKILMVSSTSVYPTEAKTMVESDASYVQSTASDAFTDNAKRLLQAEQCVIDSGLDYAIVRCSGLMGPERHPSRFVARLSAISDQAPANMIHQTDAIGVLRFALSNIHRDVVNATTPTTVDKAQFYRAALKQANMTTPLPPITHTGDKRVSAEKLVKLGYVFHYQSTLDALAL